MWALFFAPETESERITLMKKYTKIICMIAAASQWNASEAYTYINIGSPIRQIAASAGKTFCCNEKDATFTCEV